MSESWFPMKLRLPYCFFPLLTLLLYFQMEAVTTADPLKSKALALTEKKMDMALGNSSETCIWHVLGVS